MVTIGNEHITAQIRPMGAELCSLTDASGTEFIWQAGAAWPRHSPVLFPIVGQVNGDEYRANGKTYHLGRHGFARDREFAPWGVTQDRASFVLADDEATRAVYPFKFHLTLDYRVTGAALRLTYLIANPGDDPLPFSIGGHPAFVWPAPKDAQELIFAEPEPAPIRRLQNGLLSPVRYETPIRGQTLALSDDLFFDDALILDQVKSRAVTFGRLRLSWCDAMPQLGIWNKPGADFICIEPWAGFSDPVGYAGELAQKPGIQLLAPGQQAEFWWEASIT